MQLIPRKPTNIWIQILIWATKRSAIDYNPLIKLTMLIYYIILSKFIVNIWNSYFNFK